MRSHLTGMARRPAGLRLRTSTHGRAALAVGGGLVATLCTGTFLATASQRWPGVLLALVLIALGPSATRLDRRLAINLSLTFGLAPLALWVPQALGTGTAPLAALSCAAGATAGAAIWRQGGLIPTVRRRDAVIPLTALIAGLIAQPLAAPRSPQQALAVVSTGIDNSYHYAMFLEQRLMSASSPLLASNADGTGFAFDDYPQWFHRLLTVLAQLTYGSPSTAPTELMRYSQLQWLVFMLLATLVTSAFMQALPHRTSALTLISATAVMYSLVLAVPGGINLIQGHLSFLVAACAPVVIFMLTIHQQRPGLGLFIVVGGLFLVAAAWSLLLPMALAASIPPLLAAWRQQSSAIRWITMLAAALTLLAMGGLFLWKPLTQGVLAAILRDGTVPRVGLPTLAAILLCSLFVLIALETRFGEIAFERHILMAVAAIMQLIALAAYMLMASGQLTYYFWKLGLGSVLVSVMTTIHAVTVAASLDDERTHPIRIRPVHAAVVVIISCIGLGSVLQQFTAPSLAWSVLVPTSLKERMAPGAAGDVDLPLRLARSMSPADAARTRLLATRPGDMNPAHASEWFHALSHSATRRAVSVDDGVYQLAGHPRDTALGVRLAMSTLSTDDGRVAVTDADLYRSILGTASPKQRPRVLLIR